MPKIRYRNSNHKFRRAMVFIAKALILSVAIIFIVVTTVETQNPIIVGSIGVISVLISGTFLYFEERHKHRKTEERLAELGRLTEELDRSAKLLIRRDLELTRANEELRQVDRVKSEFVTLVTHQLRTPLSGIRWSVSMLLNGEMGTLSADQKLYLMKTYESNERMISLINDMLTADRIESGTMKFQFTPTDLVSLVETGLEEMQPLATLKKIKVVRKADPKLPLVSVDPENLHIVIQNLIENAIKYTPPSGKIAINIYQSGPMVEFSVSDSGIGIPKDQHKKVFGRFFRAPNAVRTATDGSGLGLYIIANIVRRHNGTVRFTSEEGKGTTFYVAFPALISKPHTS